MGYSSKYYKRHYDKYRKWENGIGVNIVKTLKLGSILDIGCGVGSYLEGAIEEGCTDVIGIELNYDYANGFFVDSVKDYIFKADATKDINLGRKFDCVMSFEVGEHILLKGTDYFIKNLVQYSNKYIILTAAPPGQKGTGHINLREKDFWINKIEVYGFKYDDDVTSRLKKDWEKIGAKWYIIQNLMFFKR